jgi:signal transduction histidine kinase
MNPASFMSRLRAWLNRIPIRDAIDRRMAILLQVMLLGFMSILVTATIISLFLAPATDSRQEILIDNAVFLLVVCIPFFLLRQGYFRSSVFTIIAAFIGLETFAIVSSDLRSIAETLSLLTLAILLAGLLIGRKALTVTFALGVAAVLIGVFRQHDPQLKLDGIAIAGNFILVNGLMSFFLGHFDHTLRTALKNALEREEDLRNEVAERERMEVEREKLIAQLEANNEELERFTYTVSHDLKSPLVTIKGFLGMLKQDLEQNRQDHVKKDFERIAEAADKMGTLLSELLELSRIGRVTNPLEEVDLVKLAHDALETLDGRIRERNVKVTVSPDLPIVYADRTRLREVLENLIDNAVKYMGDQAHPLIEINKRESGTETVICIKDNGIGIEPQFHTKIFGLFEKLSAESEGTGIGLALVKRIIEVHGGRIWVESEGLGKGSAFCFTILDGRKL